MGWPDAARFVPLAAPPPCDAEEEAFDRWVRECGREWLSDVWDADLEPASEGGPAELPSQMGSVDRRSLEGSADRRDLHADSVNADSAYADSVNADSAYADSAFADSAFADSASADSRWAWNPPPAAPVMEAADAYAQLGELDRVTALLELRRADLLAWLVDAQASADLRRLGPDATPTERDVARTREHARVAVIDTLVATTGARRGPWIARAQVALAEPALADPLREAVSEQVLTFEQAADVVRDSGEVGLPSVRRVEIARDVVAHAQAARRRGGTPVGQRRFRAELRRQLITHGGAHARRRAVDEARGVWLQTGEDGAATMTITGRDARGVAALTRVDAIARAVRHAGDPRTLAQLRSDVALDLLIFGRPAAKDATAVDHPGGEGWPPAIVDVVVSAASLLGANDEPGLVHDTPVAAETIRRMALAEGGVWRRIVTDPVTGYAMAAHVDSYRPPAAMARVVRARDRRCRAPGCTRPACVVDIDHVHERRDGGPTSAANCQCLCRQHHSKKTRHHWNAAIDTDGVVTWRLPDGTTSRTYPFDYRELGTEILAEAEAEAEAEAAREGVPRAGSAPAARASLDIRNVRAAARHEEGDPLLDWHRRTQRQLRDEARQLREGIQAARAERESAVRDLQTYRQEHPPF